MSKQGKPTLGWQLRQYNPLPLLNTQPDIQTAALSSLDSRLLKLPGSLPHRGKGQHQTHWRGASEAKCWEKEFKGVFGKDKIL